MRVAVDEARDRAEAAPVELDDVAVEHRQLAHEADGGDRVAGTEDVGVLDDVDGTERRAPQRGVSSSGRGKLRKVANEEPRCAHASNGADAIFSPPRSAASIASG